MGIDASAACAPDSLAEVMQQKSAMQALIQQHLARAKNRMKSQADKKRTERSFNVGDWVYAKLSKHQWRLALTKSWLTVSSGRTRLWTVLVLSTYKLLLPGESTVHPVFHVSQLKGAVLVALPASPLPVSFTALQVPERILQKRVASTNSGVDLQALIQWSGLPAALATWEDVEALRQRFPHAPAWGQAGSYQGGDVSGTSTSASEHGGKTSDVAQERERDVAQTEYVILGPRRGMRMKKPSVRTKGPAEDGVRE